MAPSSPKGIFAVTEELVKILVAAGVRATADPRRVDPPCVLVVPERAEFDTNCLGEATTSWVLHCLAGQPGGLEAMKDLSVLTAKTIAAIPRIESVDLNSYATDSGQSWPSFDLRFRTVSQWA